MAVVADEAEVPVDVTTAPFIDMPEAGEVVDVGVGAAVVGEYVDDRLILYMLVFWFG